jgi:hypothetical protein
MTVFRGGAKGEWRIERIDPYLGDTLPTAAALAVDPADGGEPAWLLRGVPSNHRYTTKAEREGWWRSRRGWAGKRRRAPR